MRNMRYRAKYFFLFALTMTNKFTLLKVIKFNADHFQFI